MLKVWKLIIEWFKAIGSSENQSTKAALLQLKGDALNGNVADKWFGICYNLTIMTGVDDDSCYNFVYSKSKGWKFHSGSSAYPVPKTSLDDSLWEGEQSELRLSLIDHLLTKC